MVTVKLRSLTGHATGPCNTSCKVTSYIVAGKVLGWSLDILENFVSFRWQCPQHEHQQVEVYFLGPRHRDTHDILLEITYAYSLWDFASGNPHFP